MADVRLKAAVAVAHAAHEVGHAAAGVAGHPRCAGELPPGHRSARGRCRVARRQCDHHGLGEQVFAVDPGHARPRRAGPLVGDHEVERARAERLERGLGLGLDELHLHAGVRVRERDDRGEDQVQARGLERADADGARDGARRRSGEVGLGALGAGQELFSVRDQHQRGVGEPQRRPAGSNSVVPASRWSTPSCCETVDGL